MGGLGEGLLRGLIWFLQDDYCVLGCGPQDNYPHLKGALPSEVLFLLESKVTRKKVKDNETAAFSWTECDRHKMNAGLLGFYSFGPE